MTRSNNAPSGWTDTRATVGASASRTRRPAWFEPVIGTLGWDGLDPDEVHREYRRRPTDNPVDYALLLLLRTPRLFIEAKGLGRTSTVSCVEPGPTMNPPSPRMFTSKSESNPSALTSACRPWS